MDGGGAGEDGVGDPLGARPGTSTPCAPPGLARCSFFLVEPEIVERVLRHLTERDFRIARQRLPTLSASRLRAMSMSPFS